MIKENIVICRNNSTNEDMNQLCRDLSKFECRAYIELTNQRINAKSLMGLIAFEFNAGDNVTLHVEGREENDALKVLKDFFA